MKRTLFYLTWVLIAALLFSSCQKQPTASFTTDKTDYIAGETVYLTNQSVDADHFLWTMPDGQTSTSADISYNTNIETETGTMSFRLEAFSKNGKKESEMIKTVNIEAAKKGDVTFWSDNAEYVITVTFGGVDSDISSTYASVPDCGAFGCANYADIYSGTYPFTATDGIHQWEGNMTVVPNNCSTMRLYLSKATLLTVPLYEPIKL